MDETIVLTREKTKEKLRKNTAYEKETIKLDRFRYLTIKYFYHLKNQ